MSYKDGWTNRKMSAIKNKIVITVVTLGAMGIFINAAETDSDEIFTEKRWQDKFIIPASKISKHGDFSHPLLAKDFFKPKICEYRMVVNNYFGENVTRLNFTNDLKENKFHELYFNAPGNINEIDPLVYKKNSANLISTLDYEKNSIQLSYTAKNYKRVLHPKGKMKFIFQEKCPEGRVPASL